MYTNSSPILGWMGRWYMGCDLAGIQVRLYQGLCTLEPGSMQRIQNAWMRSTSEGTLQVLARCVGQGTLCFIPLTFLFERLS